ncbi:hypothetical protein AB0B15_38400 [Streptomyces sp. NPDC045456]|uniref:hypothetical protein n=1 Tax=Streptomyces sp. NPDC045456 TaxID=3155254 RepID=UPI0033CBEA12
MTAVVLRGTRRLAAGLVAAVHHIVTSAPALTGLAGAAGLAAFTGQTAAFVALAAAGVALCAESIRADLTGRPFPACPLCTRARRGARKEITE